MTNEEAVRLLEDMYIYRTRKIPARYKPTKEALKVAVEALKRKTGKWIGEYKEVTIDENGNTTGSCHCSACGDWLTGSDEYPTRGRYCPNCGVKMQEVQ